MPFKDKEAQREYQRQWVARRRSEYMADKCCAVCGRTDKLEIDHIDPETKVSHSIWSWSEKRRAEELAKCQILCGDCHQRKSSQFCRDKFSYIDLCARGHHLELVGRYGPNCRYCHYLNTCKRRGIVALSVEEFISR